jgi:hypothetical protein
MSSCGPVYSYADQVVPQAWTEFRGYAQTAFGMAEQALGAVASFVPITQPTNVTFTVSGGPGTFVAPPVPDDDISSFVEPPEPPDVEIMDVVVGNAPSGEPSAPPRPKYTKPGGEPGAFTGSLPDEPPPFAEITIPEAPDLVTPDDPALFLLSIPSAPDLVIPDFDGIRPVIDFTVPDGSFNFTEIEYTSDLLDSVRAKLELMLAGGTGLPAAIEQALFDRARVREDITAQKLVQETLEEFASRGCDEIPGVAAKRLMEARQANQNAVNQLSRDIYINADKTAREEVRFAVERGVAYEQMLLQAHLTKEERRYQSARFMFEMSLNIFNARVSLHNAQVNAYQADAMVYRSRVEALQVEANIYKTEVEAQAVVADINRTISQIHESKIRAMLAEIEVYKAELEGRRLQLQVQTNRVDLYRTQVQAYGEHVRAYGTEWNVYATRVQAEMGEIQAGEVAARMYASHVGAWQTKYDAVFKRASTEVEIERLEVQKGQLLIQKFAALLESERSKINSEVQALTARAQVYSAAGSIAQAESAAADRSYQLAIAQATTEAQLLQRNGEIQIEQSRANNALELQGLITVAQTTAQLAAAALTALNASASISSQASNSSSCSTQYNISE